MSISEEIEGRSAITVMSKPVSRRQFLLGKFLGTLMAALLLEGILALIFIGVLWFKPWFDKEPLELSPWVAHYRSVWGPWLGEASANFVLGMGVWLESALHLLPGLLFGFCQVSVLLAIATSLATRLPMVVNLVTCFAVFFLGHLTPVLVEKSEGRYQLINFMAKFFNNVLPGLEYFDLSTLIVRDVPPDPRIFVVYMGSVFLYAILYTVIALLFGLILFEDRDLA
jgi:ABC-2 family transporter protein